VCGQHDVTRQCPTRSRISDLYIVNQSNTTRLGWLHNILYIERPTSVLLVPKITLRRGNGECFIPSDVDNNYSVHSSRSEQKGFYARSHHVYTRSIRRIRQNAIKHIYDLYMGVTLCSLLCNFNIYYDYKCR